MQDNQINEIEFTQTYNIYGNSKYKAFSEKFLLMEGNQVKLKPFAISTTLITQDLYKKIMRDDINTNFSPSYFKNMSNNPIESISWYDALFFCNKLTHLYMSKDDTVYKLKEIIRDKKTKAILKAHVEKDFEKKGYRLPFEIEWEYTARGRTNHSIELWSGSSRSRSTLKKAARWDPNLDMVGWYLYNSNFSTHPVNEKLSNSNGCFDMSGNVWEWCWDEYEKGDYRIIKGGSWSYFACGAAISERFFAFPSCQNSDIGLRVCRSL